MGTPSWKGVITGTYVNHNHFAGWIEMSLPLAIGLIEYINDKGKRMLLYYSIVIMGISQLLSLSRGGWISCSLSLFIMAYLLNKRYILSKRKWIIVTVLFVFFLSSIFGLSIISNRFSTFKRLFEDPVNFDTRVKVWKGTLQIIFEHPIIGTGLGTFPFAFTRYRPPGLLSHYLYAHNDFLDLSSEMGIGFLFLFIWLIYSFSKTGLTIFLNSMSRFKRGLALGSTIGIVAITIHSLFDFNLHIPANLLLFVTLCAFLGSLETNQARLNRVKIWKAKKG